MKTDSQYLSLKFCELHNAMFLAGKNFGLKLDPTKIVGLRLEYDRKEKELLVYWADEVGIIPSSNIAVMVPGKVEVRVESLHPIVQGKLKAQASSPLDHVFAGPGAGKTGKEA